MAWTIIVASITGLLYRYVTLLEKSLTEDKVLFNSYQFIFLFLPLTLLVFLFLSSRNQEHSILWLVIASLFFYGWWNPAYLALIILSMLLNYLFGRLLGAQHNHTLNRRRWLLGLGVSLNLATLAYYKYAGFFVQNINAIAGTDFNLESIILPLAISFFTFQQIAYLVDAYRGITREYRFIHYALFVTFFPQLIAGPIVHHKEMLPQFLKSPSSRKVVENISIGITIFAIGLFKKTVLADNAALYASPVFSAADAGGELSFLVAWGGALAYTMQLYFDFSGYSDMAIGAARMFGIKLPLNFHSPYKATSIVEFWRRWHMTLSRFLRDYLYIPLGGNKRGPFNRYRNLFLTMLLGGLWHGAGWTFVAWGALHGFYLIVNHAWHRGRAALFGDNRVASPVGKLAGWLLTFVAVIVGWVLFRATSFSSALTILEGMAGLNGVELPNAIVARLGGVGEQLRAWGMGTYLGGGSQFMWTWLWVGLLTLAAILFPNTQQIMSRFEPALTPYKHPESAAHSLPTLLPFKWRPTGAWAVMMGLIATLGVLALTSVSEFLYFQF